MTHECSVCWTPAETHPYHCGLETSDGRPCSHFLLPLCCPGCDCGSFEQQHPQEAAEMRAQTSA